MDKFKTLDEVIDYLEAHWQRRTSIWIVGEEFRRLIDSIILINKDLKK